MDWHTVTGWEGVKHLKESREGGGVMPYMCHTETCRRSGYTFWPSKPRQGVFFRLTLKQGAKIVWSLWARVRIHSTVWHPPIGFNYLSFVQEINPSFDVFNIFKVLIWHTVQEFVRVSFKNNSFLYFDTLFRWLLSFPSSNLPREFAPPPKKLVWKQLKN